MRAPSVELEPVDFGLVRHCGDVPGAGELVFGAEVGDSHRLRVNQVGNFLAHAGATPATFLHPD